MNTKDILLYCQFGNYIDLNECACALCSLRKHILFPNNFRQTIKMANGNGNLHCFLFQQYINTSFSILRTLLWMGFVSFKVYLCRLFFVFTFVKNDLRSFRRNSVYALLFLLPPEQKRICHFSMLSNLHRNKSEMSRDIVFWSHKWQ